VAKFIATKPKLKPPSIYRMLLVLIYRKNKIAPRYGTATRIEAIRGSRLASLAIRGGGGGSGGDGLGLDPVPGAARDDLAGPHPELAVALHDRRAVVVDVAEEAAAGVAADARALAVDAPVVAGLEEGADPVLGREPEARLVHPREGQRALVPGLEEDARRVQVRRRQVQVRAARRAPVRGGGVGGGGGR